MKTNNFFVVASFITIWDCSIHKLDTYKSIINQNTGKYWQTAFWLTLISYSVALRKKQPKRIFLFCEFYISRRFSLFVVCEYFLKIRRQRIYVRRTLSSSHQNLDDHDKPGNCIVHQFQIKRQKEGSGRTVPQFVSKPSCYVWGLDCCRW